MEFLAAELPFTLRGKDGTVINGIMDAVFKTKEGKPYKLVKLPTPSAKYDEDRQRLPATYANFLIINGAVLVPTYNDKNDAEALKIFKKLFNIFIRYIIYF
jgi:agmatine/peptidylarginine deiminase